MPNFHRNGGAHLKSEEKLRVLLVSIVPPKNDCGVRIVMHRQLVGDSPFELHVASNTNFEDNLLVHTRLRLPYLIHRLRKSRFGPRLAAWITDYENLIWPLTTNGALEGAVEDFKPDVVLTLAECWVVSRCSKNSRTPRVAAGRTISRLVSDDEGSLRSHINPANFEPVLPRALCRL